MKEQFTTVDSTFVRTTAQQQGFTLIELMLVVAIIGILAAIAYPSYEDFQIKSRRSDATSMLMQLAATQEQFFMDNRRYTDDFTEMGFPNAGSVTSDDGHYLITVNLPDNFSFVLTATPQGRQAGADTTCASFTLDNLGTRGNRQGNTVLDPCW